MKLFTASIITETNSFSPWPTGASSFTANGIWRSNTAGTGTNQQNRVARVFQNLAKRDGHSIYSSLFTSANPSGPVVRAVYEMFRDEIIADFKREGPFDMALLFLHGAMIADGYDDCEADLVSRLRELGGKPLVIGVMLDPHCHLSDRLVELSDVVLALKEYPHIDFEERAKDLYNICTGAGAKQIRPVMHVFDCCMIGSFPTTSSQMTAIVDQMRQAETLDGVLSVSFVHGFPWGDAADSGAKVLAVTDGDLDLARHISTQIGHSIYRQRDELLPKYKTISEAMAYIQSREGRFVLADTADNPGGGAPGDNISLLCALLERNVAGVAYGMLWDPIIATLCLDAGIGAQLQLRLGGKCGASSGTSVDFPATVLQVNSNHYQSGLSNERCDMGISAAVSIYNVEVVICSNRVQTMSPDAFTNLGIDLVSKRIVCVKSSNHYRAHFSSLYDECINVATPGALQIDFSALPLRQRRSLNFHPRVNDPLGLNNKQ